MTRSPVCTAGVAIDPDGAYSAYGWLFLSQAYDQKGNGALARLAAAEENFALGQTDDARMFAMRARHAIWSRAAPTGGAAADIVLTSKPSREDLRMLAQEGSVDAPAKRNSRTGTPPS